MNWLLDILTNPFLIAGVSSWLIAQVVKTILHWIIYKKLDFKRIYGDGGMPSGHSATVSALAVFCGLRLGFSTPEFAIALILAIIVCKDATGVRREAGRQAEVLNELLKLFNEEDAQKLKEFIGHTPIQVFAGILIGISNALLMHFVFL